MFLRDIEGWGGGVVGLGLRRYCCYSLEVSYLNPSYHYNLIKFRCEESVIIL